MLITRLFKITSISLVLVAISAIHPFIFDLMSV